MDYNVLMYTRHALIAHTVLALDFVCTVVLRTLYKERQYIFIQKYFSLL